MKSPDVEKQKPAFWAGSLNSGARTRTNAAGVEQRACRAGPEGVSRCAANNRTEFYEESERFRNKWKAELEAGDPYFNPNFSLDKSDFSLRV